MNPNNEDFYAMFFLLLLVCACLGACTLGFHYGREEAYQQAYRDCVSGRIDQEVKQKYPALWIQINADTNSNTKQEPER